MIMKTRTTEGPTVVTGEIEKAPVREEKIPQHLQVVFFIFETYLET